MDVYKLRPGLQPIHTIEKNRFEADTQMAFPWYQATQKGSDAVFAVCPACDNPIRIVAMYERRENSPVCHGRHMPRSVPGVADYDQHAYDSCIYANPDAQRNPGTRRPGGDPRGRDILTLLRQQFDRIIYVLVHCTGIRIREGLAREMLRSFLGMRGHLYVGTTLCNLPWLFGHMATAHSL